MLRVHSDGICNRTCASRGRLPAHIQRPVHDFNIHADIDSRTQVRSVSGAVTTEPIDIFRNTLRDSPGRRRINLAAIDDQRAIVGDAIVVGDRIVRQLELVAEDGAPPLLAAVGQPSELSAKFTCSQRQFDKLPMPTLYPSRALKSSRAASICAGAPCPSEARGHACQHQHDGHPNWYTTVFIGDSPFRAAGSQQHYSMAGADHCLARS